VTRLDGGLRNISRRWIGEYHTTWICEDVLGLGLLVWRLIQERITLTARFLKIFLEFALWFLLLFLCPVAIFIFQTFLIMFLIISAFCPAGILGHDCGFSPGVVGCSSMISADAAGCFKAVIADWWCRGTRARGSVREKRVPPRCVCFGIVTKVVDGSDRLLWGAALDDTIRGGCESL